MEIKDFDEDGELSEDSQMFITPPSSVTSDNSSTEGNTTTTTTTTQYQTSVDSPLTYLTKDGKIRKQRVNKPRQQTVRGGGVNKIDQNKPRQKIETDLISKEDGKTERLNLTKEEIKTFAAEKLPVPTVMPLSESDWVNLRRVRRKIKNKISAQDSRRRKKEYIKHLEQVNSSNENTIGVLMKENTSFRQQIEILTNRVRLLENSIKCKPEPV